MSLIKEIQRLEKENTALRARGARLPGKPGTVRPRGKSLAQELSTLERENATLKAQAIRAKATAPARAQVDNNPAPATGPRKCLTTAEKGAQSKRPPPKNEFTYLKNGCVVADPEAAQACRRRLAIEAAGGVEDQR